MNIKTPKGRFVPDVFKDMAEWEPEYVKTLTDEIWDAFVTASGTTEENLHTAIDMVYHDGNYGGPAYRHEYQEMFDADFYLKDALRYVRAAMSADIEDVEWFNPDYPSEEFSDWEDQGMAIPNMVIKAKDIVKSVFGWYYEIYGGK